MMEFEIADSWTIVETRGHQQATLFAKWQDITQSYVSLYVKD